MVRLPGTGEICTCKEILTMGSDSLRGTERFFCSLLVSINYVCHSDWPASGFTCNVL